MTDTESILRSELRHCKATTLANLAATLAPMLIEADDTSLDDSRLPIEAGILLRKLRAIRSALNDAIANQGA